MGKRSKRAQRCNDCRMHLQLCLCDRLPQLHMATKVAVVMHHRESTKTTASAPLFLLAHPESALYLRGRKETPFDDSGLVEPERRSLLLFPREGALTLTPELVAQDCRPITLVVPDGSWRQASKACKREPTLAGMQCVVLPDMGETRYRLRREPKQGGLSTFEAIARALRIIEGEAIYQSLDQLFTTMVERTLATRGNSAQPLKIHH